jgi:hypothetical protein
VPISERRISVPFVLLFVASLMAIAAVAAAAIGRVRHSVQVLYIFICAIFRNKIDGALSLRERRLGVVASKLLFTRP